MSKKLMIITNIKIKGASRCVKCLTIKSFFDKITKMNYGNSFFNRLNLIQQNMITNCIKCREKTKI